MSAVYPMFDSKSYMVFLVLDLLRPPIGIFPEMAYFFDLVSNYCLEFLAS